MSSIAVATHGRRRHTVGHYVQNVVLYAAVVVIFGPIAWMVFTSFKSEAAAYTMPPQIVVHLTLSEYAQALSGFLDPFLRSVLMVGVSTIISLALGIPAAFALTYYESKRNDGILFWFITTKALPQAAVVIPLFIIFRELHLLDTPWVLIIAYTGLNTPIVVWMMRQFMRDIPRGILEAAEVDGVSPWGMLLRVVIPLSRAGAAATAMLCIVFAWNEFLFSLSFTATSWDPLSVAVSAQQTSRGQYWAQLSAFTTLAIIVPVIVGWFTQKQLVRGLTAGAEK